MLRGRFSHRMLNLIGKPVQMLSQPVVHFPLGRVRREVPDQGAFRRIFTEFFQTGLIILHGKIPPVTASASRQRF